MILELRIKYHVEDLIKIEKIEKGDWIDLRSAYDYELKAGEFYLIDLGISVKVPDGYEMHILPRSSSYKNWGILQVNSMGILDQSYCGETDLVKMPVYATRDIKIEKNDRICQFRLIEKMPRIIITEVKKMTDNPRGGFGSTGVK
jgi:dUTP pyrophosphatase